jgi:hypothetical protein
MTPEEAEEYLIKREGFDCSRGCIYYCGGIYISYAGGDEARLEGEFSADTLEAISVFMRHHDSASALE